MTDDITIIPYGSLQKITPTERNGRRLHPIDGRQPLHQILEAVGIAGNEIQLVMVNHRPAQLDAMVGRGDRVALFPKEYPIFVDWHSYRNVSA